VAINTSTCVAAERAASATGQDARIDNICATVSNLRRTTAAINEELQLQAGMVESLADDVDRTGGRMRKAEQKSAALAGVRSETAHRGGTEEAAAGCRLQ